VQNSLAEIGPELADFAEFGSEFARSFTSHIGGDDSALFFLQVVIQRTAKAFAFDGFGNHSRPPAPIKAKRRRATSSVKCWSRE
jgi:hypothetical protein